MNFKKTYTYNVSLPHSENASCPLSAFPTFRIFFGKLLDIITTFLFRLESGSGGGLLNRKRKGAQS